MAKKKGKRHCKYGFKKGTRTCRKTRATRRKGGRASRRPRGLFTRKHRAGTGAYKVTCGGKRVYTSPSKEKAAAAGAAYHAEHPGMKCIVHGKGARVATFGRYR